ncbi:MAG: leucyl/phenylalanyl-tRNA--protein transferase [Flavobacteriaceae bacterium]|nr:leucyl/phenylalanyl-tRNA--protein transferase [Flavobacteriaceae bacterium]
MISVDEVLNGYRIGIFPMANPEEGNSILWYEPDLRGIIPLDEFKASKNLLKLYRSGTFEYTFNLEFEEVMRQCAARSETWISEEIIELYTTLHTMGFAYSFETRLSGKLVGGLYGVAIGKAFFGESMFHSVTNASKLSMVYLVNYLKVKQYTLLDTQYLTPHLAQFGCIEIPKNEYLLLLRRSLG